MMAKNLKMMMLTMQTMKTLWQKRMEQLNGLQLKTLENTMETAL